MPNFECPDLQDAYDRQLRRPLNLYMLYKIYLDLNISV